MLHYSTAKLLGVLKGAGGRRISERVFVRLLAGVLGCDCPPPKQGRYDVTPKELEDGITCRHIYDVTTCLMPALEREGLVSRSGEFVDVSLAPVDMIAGALRKQLKATDADEERYVTAQVLATKLRLF